MRFLLKLMAILFFVFIIGCKPQSEEEEKNLTADQWKILFNGKDLSGWDSFLGMPYKEGMDIWQQKQLPDYKPFGLNNDSLKVFSVVKVDGQPALRLSGEVYGGLSTIDEYENYHLRLEFKWGELKFAPRLDAPRDSGLLYHGVGEQGAEAGFWLRSQEMQIQENDCGDYWGIAGAHMDIRTEIRPDSLYQYNPNGELRIFGDTSEFGRNAKKFPDGEKPKGEWNILDLYCYGGESAHIVNGVVTMILENSTVIIDSVSTPLTKGKIQLQTEGAEVFYRNIKIKPITGFPSLKP